MKNTLPRLLSRLLRTLARSLYPGGVVIGCDIAGALPLRTNGRRALVADCSFSPRR